LKIENSESLLQYMVDTAVLLGANVTFAESEMSKNLQFEVELAMITVPKELRRNMTNRYNPTTTGEAKTYPVLHPSWTTYIQVPKFRGRCGVFV